MISMKPRIVSSSFTYLPGVPVKASATKNGCERKRCTLRARWTTSLSSSESSSMPEDGDDVLQLAVALQSSCTRVAVS
jgi:hypothetical protein